MLSVPYLVKCLEEDHISHGITIQEPRPRPIKDSPLEISHNFSSYTWLHQDGKPPESAHTWRIFSYSNPRKQHSAEEASTPIIVGGGETPSKTTIHSLITTVRTLPAIAGLQVLGEPIDIGTDYGASSQDLRHLFACSTHQTDLSPEDLWRNPVGLIREFSYLD